MTVTSFLNFVIEETSILIDNPSHLTPISHVQLHFTQRLQTLLRSSSSVVDDSTLSDYPLPPILIPPSALATPLLCNLHILKAISAFNLDRQLRDFLSRHLTHVSLSLSVGFRLLARVEILTVHAIDELHHHSESSSSSNWLTKELASRVLVEKLKRQQKKKRTSSSTVIDDDEVGTCAICLEEFSSSESNEDDEKLMITMPCSHGFHELCLVQWLEKQNSCPMCRRALHVNDFDDD